MYALEKGVANLLRHAFQLNPIIRAKILQYKTHTSRCIRYEAAVMNIYANINPFGVIICSFGHLHLVSKNDCNFQYITVKQK